MLNTLRATWAHRLQAPTILILDDQIDHLQLLGQYILELFPSCKLLRAHRAELALEIMHTYQPDLLLSDWQLPDMTGLELLTHLKAEPCFQDTPVIICSGMMTRPEDLKEALALGAADYLRKPVDRLELYARMHSALRLGFTLKDLRDLNASKDTLFSLFSEHLVDQVSRVQLALILAEDLQAYDSRQASDYRQQAVASTGKLYHVLQDLLQWCHMRFQPTPLITQPFALRKLCESVQKDCAALYLRINRELTLSTDPALFQALMRYLVLSLQAQGVTVMTLQARAVSAGTVLKFNLEQGADLEAEVLKRLFLPQFSLRQEIQQIHQTIQALVFQEQLQALGCQLSWSRHKQQWQVVLRIP
jgi:DNA-binding response OmpR family regulator